MANIIIQGGTSGTGTYTLSGPNTNSTQTITLPDVSGTALIETALSASTTNTVTNKIAVNIGGTVYYLLASTSGA